MTSRPQSAGSQPAGQSSHRQFPGLAKAATAIGAAVAALVLASPASAETVKIGYIEGLSGPFAPVGQNILKEYQYVVDLANSKGWAG
jgi:ABC-type branched-subunit amino acid transport system substrate-binding protein